MSLICDLCFWLTLWSSFTGRPRDSHEIWCFLTQVCVPRSWYNNFGGFGQCNSPALLCVCRVCESRFILLPMCCCPAPITYIWFPTRRIWVPICVCFNVTFSWILKIVFAGSFNWCTSHKEHFADPSSTVVKCCREGVRKSWSQIEAIDHCCHVSSTVLCAQQHNEWTQGWSEKVWKPELLWQCCHGNEFYLFIWNVLG